MEWGGFSVVGPKRRQEMVSSNRKAKSSFSTLHHLSIAVRNMDEAIRFYTSIGIGPFEDYPPLKEYTKIDVPDEVGFRNLKIKVVQIGPIQIQLIQPGEGKSLYKDFLEKKGEGVYHLGFVVDDVDDSEAELKTLGLEVLSSGRREDGSGFSYLDTAGKGGVTLLIRKSPDGKKNGNK
jgi:methylmalonyl-CoA/ethylmalonyl-CoA epimerase